MREPRTRAASTRTPVADADEAIRLVAPMLHEGDAVLVKGSRALGLERVADGLVTGGTSAAGQCRGRRSPVIAMLMAAGAAFVVTIFFTPLLIRSLRARGIGQQIRDDGPIEHPHIAKAGTPTMGGIAIVLATVVGYLFAHIRRNSIAFATPGWALIALIVGLGFVGWIDDYLGVRARRNLGLRKRGKTLGIVVDRGRVRVARGGSSCTPTRTSRSPSPSTSTSARSGCSSGSSSSCTPRPTR